MCVNIKWLYAQEVFKITKKCQNMYCTINLQDSVMTFYICYLPSKRAMG